MKVFLAFSLIVAGSAAYYLFVYRPAHSMADVAYALAGSVEVVDTPAQVHAVIGTLKQGERVEVRRRTRNWTRVRLADGRIGWVEAKSLLDLQTYEAAQRLLKECEDLPAQAVGHAGDTANLHLEPSREAPQISQLAQKQQLEVFGRHLIDRPPPRSNLPSGTGPGAASLGREAWYLVRTDSKAGWVLGRLVELDPPESVAVYGQGTNLVAWLALNSVDDHGQRVPQYLIADRFGTQEYDFTHIRVLTWSKAHHHYATAYVEGNLRGYFPIRVMNTGGIPYFRLRLMDRDERKVQKVYGLFDTITRSLGTVDGWESSAAPTQSSKRERIQRARVAKTRS